MKKLFIATLLLTATVLAQAAEVTLVSTKLDSILGSTNVLTKFQINTEMKEAFAKIEVDEALTTYIPVCTGGGYPYPAPVCRSVPQVTIRTIFAETVKIEGMTMNGDEVIYQGQNGDVVCGKMGISRIFKRPTFFLSGKCSLEGNVQFVNGIKKLTVKFITK
jgi:hypothetical protein